VSILPQAFHSLILPGLWLAGLALIGLSLGSQYNPSPAPRPAPRWLGGWAVLAGVIALAVAAFAWSLRPLPRSYAVEDLRHFVGTLMQAGELDQQRVLIARPEVADAPGVLASTRAQFYPPGHYVWRLRLQAGSAPAEAILATTRIYGARQAVSSETADIHTEAVPADGQFHTVELQFDNPIHQALVFELTYTAAATLATDGFGVTAAP
jgi:hypothetical protein